MSVPARPTPQQNACHALASTNYDISAKLFAAYTLNRLACENPHAMATDSIRALGELLLDYDSDRRRQRLFLFREAAQALTAVMTSAPDLPTARYAFDTMVSVLARSHEHAHRAAAEALGALPVNIHGPALSITKEAAPLVSWDRFLAETRIPSGARWTAKGRSLVTPLNDGQRLFVVKLARTPVDADGLFTEKQWMHYLGTLPLDPTVRFDVPRPRPVNGGWVVRFQNPPPVGPVPETCSSPAAFGYEASQDYFTYPNPFDDERAMPSTACFAETIGRNAFLLGTLCRRGIGHQAPIPLFHNRVQQERRRDGGLYEWFRAGRLDRWLASCAYPNFGASGLRDFEHLVSVNAAGGTLDLYRLMGCHFLSLLLVAASYFRAREPHKVGWTAEGRPVDVRHLFDRETLAEWVELIFNHYYRGFIGQAPGTALPVNAEHLAARMVDEMGVDHHMEEILRVSDQQRMTRQAFEAFLAERGFSPADIARTPKGQADLTLHTGPHLGQFNRGISIPELIEAVAAMSAMCVAGKYQTQHE
jgi:hypothetical protein